MANGGIPRSGDRTKHSKKGFSQTLLTSLHESQAISSAVEFTHGNLASFAQTTFLSRQSLRFPSGSRFVPRLELGARSVNSFFQRPKKKQVKTRFNRNGRAHPISPCRPRLCLPNCPRQGPSTQENQGHESRAGRAS